MVTNGVAYRGTKLIMAVNIFRVQGLYYKTFTDVIYGLL